jgi:hypothetical protein
MDAVGLLANIHHALLALLGPTANVAPVNADQTSLGPRVSNLLKN